MEHADVFQPEAQPGCDDPLLVVRDELALRVAVAARRGNDHEVLFRPAGELDELLVDAGPVQVAAADDQQGALRGSVLRRLDGRLRRLRQ
jgi:hypothetical protein